MAWRRVWRWTWRAGLALLAAWLIFSVVLVVSIIIYGTQDYARSADVIIVLGAGVKADGTPSQTLLERSLRGAALWDAGVAPRLICTGAVIGASPRAESDACREVLENAGVPPDAIVIEDRSVNTEENARYTLELMQAKDWQSAVVVSSRYHLLRARWLYWQQGLNVHTSPARIDYLTTQEILYSYFREWGAFHWNAVRPYLNAPHFIVPVP